MVTAESGAVIHDICRVAGARDPGLSIVLVPAPVQGMSAGPALAAAVRHAAALPGIDALIVGRGGGSMEDLWCFNDEAVVRAVAASPVPVVSAVGHQTDFTLCDFAADVRAATPSNAAELLTAHGLGQIVENLAQQRMRLDDCISDALYGAELHLARIRRRLTAVSPEQQLQSVRMRAERLRFRMDKAVETAVAGRQPRLAVLKLKLDSLADQRVESARHRVEKLQTRIEAANPDRILERGYARVSDGETTIQSAEQAREHVHMMLTFRDGRLPVTYQKEN